MNKPVLDVSDIATAAEGPAGDHATPNHATGEPPHRRRHMGQVEARRRVLRTLSFHDDGLLVGDLIARHPHHAHALRGAVSELARRGQVSLVPAVGFDRAGRPRMTRRVLAGAAPPPARLTYVGFSGAALRGSRGRLGITRAELGAALGVSESAVRHWESSAVVPAARREEIVRAIAHLRSRARPAARPVSPLVAAKFGLLRRERGWSQRRLARTLGVSQSTISNWEQGRGLGKETAARIYLILRGAPGWQRVCADELRDARLRAGLTRRELAAKLGVGIASIGRWEGGRAVSQRNARRVAGFLAAHDESDRGDVRAPRTHRRGAGLCQAVATG